MVTAWILLIESSQANFVIHFISDYQQSAQAVRFADMIPDVINGRPVNLTIHQVKIDNVPNWSVASIEVTEVDKVRVGILNNSQDAQSIECRSTSSVSSNDVQQRC